MLSQDQLLTNTEMQKHSSLSPGALVSFMFQSSLRDHAAVDSAKTTSLRLPYLLPHLLSDLSCKYSLN